MESSCYRREGGEGGEFMLLGRRGEGRRGRGWEFMLNT